MSQVTVDANDLIAALKNQRNAMADEIALQAAFIAELQRQKQALAEELKKKETDAPGAPAQS